ncbi:hypothetical protein FDP41_007133 [Naegleria fowleri]|uniref:Uncharacterized protein n=1 Tax=Naegleria fowleri TaxID=5763 RepID=A0A6A5BGG7_NAEFO|nr:uncharacterized protein FDP41_007133 [Naegleria fowleri]KAF0973746.1 hypothetical protein FDP41_007133 [Naegleria fowleri]CAG4709164.1 unnamed protein product [Naegleria fowleri]
MRHQFSFPSSLHAYQQLALNPDVSPHSNAQLLMSEGWMEENNSSMSTTTTTNVTIPSSYCPTCGCSSSISSLRSKLNHKPNRKGIVLKGRQNSSVMASPLRHSQRRIASPSTVTALTAPVSSNLQIPQVVNPNDGSDALSMPTVNSIPNPTSHVSKTKVLFPTKHISKWSQVVNGGTFVHSISNLLEKSNHKLQIKELSPSGQIHFVNMMNRDVNLMQTIELYTSLTPHKFTLAYRLKFNMQNGIFTMSSQPDSQILQQGDVNTQTTRHGWALFQISREKGSENLMFPNKIIEVAILL